MKWITEWEAISARIGSLLDAGAFLMAAHSAVSSSDPWGASRVLMQSAIEVFEEIRAFQARHRTLIPPAAGECLDFFVYKKADFFKETLDTSGERFHGMKTLLTFLAAFRSEFAYLLKDTEASARSLVDRALLHLQRSIIADTSIGQKWRTAFGNGEVACERLGAAHLLLFGIYSFKANAEGERTDLVLGQRLAVSEIEGAVEALVLTEWRSSKERRSSKRRPKPRSGKPGDIAPAHSLALS